MTADPGPNRYTPDEHAHGNPPEARPRRLFESHLAPTGTTTVPKALREALGVLHGARLVWQQQADGTILVSLKHVYAARLVPTVQDAAARMVKSSQDTAHAGTIAGQTETHENPPLLRDGATHTSSA